MNPQRARWKARRAEARAERKRLRAQWRRDVAEHGDSVEQQIATAAEEALREAEEALAQEEREEGEAREKGTDEVADSSGGDGDLHGGDGNSGEVEGSVAQTKPAWEVAREFRASQLRDALREGETELARELARELGASVTGHSRRSADERAARAGGWSPSYAPSREEVARMAAKAKRCGVTREIAERVKRLIEGKRANHGKRAPVPLVSGQKLVRELVQKSYRLSRAKAERRHRGTYAIIAVDVSGSCSSYSFELCAALASLTQDEDIVFVQHVNGELTEVWGRELGSWEELAEGVDVVLNIGDTDALEDIRGLWEAKERKLPVVWLDNFCASYGAIRGCPAAYAGVFPDEWEILYGVGGAEGVRDALRMLTD